MLQKHYILIIIPLLLFAGNIEQEFSFSTRDLAFTTSHGYGVVYDHVTCNDDAATVYLAAYTGFYKTTDGGAQWYESISGLGSPIYVTSMGIAPSEPTTLYTSGNGYALDYKSTNCGSDWTRRPFCSRTDQHGDGTRLAYNRLERSRRVR